MLKCLIDLINSFLGLNRNLNKYAKGPIMQINQNINQNRYAKGPIKQNFRLIGKLEADLLHPSLLSSLTLLFPLHSSLNDGIVGIILTHINLHFSLIKSSSV